MHSLGMALSLRPPFNAQMPISKVSSKCFKTLPIFRGKSTMALALPCQSHHRNVRPLIRSGSDDTVSPCFVKDANGKLHSAVTPPHNLLKRFLLHQSQYLIPDVLNMERSIFQRQACRLPHLR